MATPATADDLSQMTDAEKFDLLTLLVEDFFRRETPRPVVLRRGERPVGTLFPDNVWSCLPPTPISREELEERIRTVGHGVSAAEMVRRVKAQLAEDGRR